MKVMLFDIEKMYKLPPGDRFFDLNEFWYFFNRSVIRLLCPLPVTANQISFLALFMGLAAAGFYLSDQPSGLVWAAVFLYAKIFLDNVDGNLARIRGEVSRVGRFLDSLTDFVVTFLVYGAIACRLVKETGDSFFWILGGFALLSAFMHCSYFVFYLVNYTSRVGVYEMNRVREDITGEDQKEHDSGQSSDPVFWMQRLHVWLYGWQDRSIEMLDRISQKLAKVTKKPEDQQVWYLDKRFLTWISPLCLCTNNMILVVFSLLGKLEAGLWTVFILGNVYLFGVQAWKVGHHRFQGSSLTVK